jgi:hypothetical protein
MFCTQILFKIKKNELYLLFFSTTNYDILINSRIPSIFTRVIECYFLELSRIIYVEKRCSLWIQLKLVNFLKL